MTIIPGTLSDADGRRGRRNRRAAAIIGAYVLTWAVLIWFEVFPRLPEGAATVVFLGINLAFGALIGRRWALLLVALYALTAWVVQVPLAGAWAVYKLDQLKGAGWETVHWHFYTDWSLVIWHITLAAGALLAGVLLRRLVRRRRQVSPSLTG